jgi:hypothetical protein
MNSAKKGEEKKTNVNRNEVEMDTDNNILDTVAVATRKQESGEGFLQLTYKRKPFTHYHDIVKLADEPITFQSISDKTIFYQILLAENVTRIQERARRRWEKWVAKRGKDLLEQSRIAYLDFHWVRALIETLNRYICDAFGLVGDRRLQTLRFMSRLWTRLNKETISQWMRIVDEELKIWEKKPNVEPKVLKVAAHMTLKLMGYLTGM